MAKKRGTKKTKKGSFATSASVLEDLAFKGHEFPKLVLDWRQVSKLKNTYSDALPEHINPNTKRVHTSFLLAATTTGRLASSDPNLQNIPIKTDDGRDIRKAFIAEKDTSGGYLYYYQNSKTGYGTFAAGETITGGTSGTTGTTESTQVSASANYPEVDKHSGEVLFLENRTKIDRSATQIEDIKLIIEF